ncbi:MAG: type II toxin-antitoxin system VapC family toxin [Novosphingobium sp.]
MVGLLLDTHAAIWLVEGLLADRPRDEVILAGLAGRCFVSWVTAWEVGLLARKNQQGVARFAALPDPLAWYSALVGKPVITETPLSAEILIASSHLPGQLHADPADRMLIATARARDCALMTRDAAIHAYAAQGHVAVIPC